jgi:hypothetical protein
MGKALVNFSDFIKATGQRMVSKPGEILAEATKNTYWFNEMMLGRDQTELIRSGNKLTEHLQLEKVSQFEFYQPGSTFQAADSDTLTQVDYHWRYAKNSYGWTDQQVMLNEGEEEKTQFKRLATGMRQNFRLTTIDGMEEAFLSAAPVAADMEGTAANSLAPQPYCLRAIVTEDGGPPDTADGAPVAWTTIGGVDPDVKTNFKNKVVTVEKESVHTKLRKGFGQMHRKLNWKKPRGAKADFFKDTKFRKLRIITNENGQDIYEQVLADGADSFRGNDAGSTSDGPLWRGIEVEYASELDNISYTEGQPRYFWLNLEYIFPVFHSKKYMIEMPPQNLSAVGQPESWVVWGLMWYQMIFRSRRRHGIIRVA